MALSRSILFLLFAVVAFDAQTPPIEPGVSQELAKWRAAHYSDVRYKLNLTLEKMSPVLKGTMEIRVLVSGGEGEKRSGGAQAETRPVGSVPPIILDWRMIAGHEKASTISNVSINGQPAVSVWCKLTIIIGPSGGTAKRSPLCEPASDKARSYSEDDDHIIFDEGVVPGENVIKLDFTSPILTSGSAITRYVDREDGSEYIYSLFVPSDASTAFPVFDQPDLKARFTLDVNTPTDWKFVSNLLAQCDTGMIITTRFHGVDSNVPINICTTGETKPISTYFFAFAAGPFERFEHPGGNASVNERGDRAANQSPISTSPARHAP